MRELRGGICTCDPRWNPPSAAGCAIHAPPEPLTSSAVPLETMIEEMLNEGYRIHLLTLDLTLDDYPGTVWARTVKGGFAVHIGSGDTPREAIEKLHAAWRERRNDG